jgi:hypothetical protein
MSNRSRHRQGPDSPTFFDINADVVVEVGDLMYQATDDVRPASSLAAGSTLALSQEAFHDAFAGVAMQAHRNGDGARTDFRIGTTGRYEFDCAAAQFEVGDLVGPADAGSSVLEDQKVVEVATPNLAIGRVAKRYSSNTTKVLVDIISTVMYGGPQVMA